MIQPSFALNNGKVRSVASNDFTVCSPVVVDRPSFIPFGYRDHAFGSARTFAMAEAQIMVASVLSRVAISLHDARPVLSVATVTMAPSYEPSFALELV
jgi:hypothetical protein